jgi:hypothetical protein
MNAPHLQQTDLIQPGRRPSRNVHPQFSDLRRGRISAFLRVLSFLAAPYDRTRPESGVVTRLAPLAVALLTSAYWLGLTDRLLGFGKVVLDASELVGQMNAGPLFVCEALRTRGRSG